MNASKAESSYLKWRSRFVLKLALFHFALIICFDLLGVFAPDIMTSTVVRGGVFTVGIVSGLGIVLSVMLTAVFYTYQINKKAVELSKEPGQGVE
jgi:uncharacterized membrane protein (DUF485 family)